MNNPCVTPHPILGMAGHKQSEHRGSESSGRRLPCALAREVFQGVRVHEDQPSETAQRERNRSCCCRACLILSTIRRQRSRRFNDHRRSRRCLHHHKALHPRASHPRPADRYNWHKREYLRWHDNSPEPPVCRVNESTANCRQCTSYAPQEPHRHSLHASQVYRRCNQRRELLSNRTGEEDGEMEVAEERDVRRSDSEYTRTAFRPAQPRRPRRCPA